MNAVSEASEADFDSVYAVNVKVPFFLTAELAPQMAKRGKGAIVTITTMVAEFGRLAAAPHGRPGQPEDIAAAVTYLASYEARFVHGAVLAVDGGRTAV